MKRFALGFVIVVFEFSNFSSGVKAKEIDKSVEEALLAEKWETVGNLLKQDDSLSELPAARMLMAQACLATNQNNESIRLFLSAKEEADQKQWLEWTNALLARHPQNPVALYLSADANARQGRFKEAKEQLTQAIALKNDFAMSYNARGMVRILNNEWNLALEDFTQATTLAPNLSDAYVNLGTYYVITEVADGAENAFHRALDFNPDFALAYNGLGCASFGKGEFEIANRYFKKALELEPLLAVAEINQGFASAYANKVMIMGNIEKKPGTTLESLHQQYSHNLKEQQQQLLNLLPSRQDQEFWKKFDTLPQILRTDKHQELIVQYGLEKVRMGVFLKMQELRNQLFETNQKVQSLYKTVDSFDKKIWNTRVYEFVASQAFTFKGVSGNLLGASESLPKSWVAFARTEMRIAKANASATAQDSFSKTVIDAIPVRLDPAALAASIASSGFKITRSFLENRRDPAYIELVSLASQMPVQCAQLQAMEADLNKLGGISPITSSSSVKAFSQIPGYYTAIDRPLTEIGAIASMVDKTIAKPVDGVSRRALVVADDPFRASLQTQELSRYGFDTKLVSSAVDVQKTARQWGANVIVGTRGMAKVEIPILERSSSKSLLKEEEVNRRTSPPFFPPPPPPIPIPIPPRPSPIPPRTEPPDPPPPPPGGGAVGLPKISPPPLPQNWNWGKPYIPPQVMPGGIRTEDIAKAFMDKGGWPVMSPFTLFYIAP